MLQFLTGFEADFVDKNTIEFQGGSVSPAGRPNIYDIEYLSEPQPRHKLVKYPDDVKYGPVGDGWYRAFLFPETGDIELTQVSRYEPDHLRGRLCRKLPQVFLRQGNAFLPQQQHGTGFWWTAFNYQMGDYVLEVTKPGVIKLKAMPEEYRLAHLWVQSTAAGCKLNTPGVTASVRLPIGATFLSIITTSDQLLYAQPMPGEAMLVGTRGYEWRGPL